LRGPLVLVGVIDPYHLNDLTKKTERYIKRKIRLLVLNRKEFKNLWSRLQTRPYLLIWTAME
jgi:hypothetical protein